MHKHIVVIEGDGIGPEVTRQAIKVLNAVAQAGGHEFNYSYHLMGACAIDKTGNPLPDETIEAALNSDAILFGAIGHPKYDNDPSAKIRPEQGLLKLRKSLQLFANIRPVTTYPALQHLSPLKAKILEDVDFVIFRELTGGIYFGKKETNAEGTLASDECSYSSEEIERIAHLAFKQAHVGFVDQRGRLQGVVGPLAAHVGVSHLAKLVIHHGEELLRGFGARLVGFDEGPLGIGPIRLHGEPLYRRRVGSGGYLRAISTRSTMAQPAMTRSCGSPGFIRTLRLM